GETAKYRLLIGGAGITGTATLTCSGAPQGATCVLPTTLAVNGKAASSFTVSVSTTTRTAVAASHVSEQPSPSCVLASLLITLITLPVMTSIGCERNLYLGVSFCLLLLIRSCGGTAPETNNSSGSDGSSGSGGNSTGTPAGTYTLTVTATIG